MLKLRQRILVISITTIYPRRNNLFLSRRHCCNRTFDIFEEAIATNASERCFPGKHSEARRTMHEKFPVYESFAVGKFRPVCVYSQLYIIYLAVTRIIYKLCFIVIVCVCVCDIYPEINTIVRQDE